MSSTDSFLFTSESVSPGHPDKICDQISDVVLDAVIKKDPVARVAVETMVKNNWVILAGEIKTNQDFNFEPLVRKTINEIGYSSDELGFCGSNAIYTSAISGQSEDISMGVDRDNNTKSLGAGDQGIMFGYAVNETDQFMPMAISLAHQLVQKQSELMHQKTLPWLRPDAKSQVTLLYKNNRPVAITDIVMSTQHDISISPKTLREAVIEEIIKPLLPPHLDSTSCRFLINPTGRFVIGGPVGDCGLTGRKIIVDTYGGAAPHGGGAFSGKDPSKVDRSGAYMMRYIAKNIVASGLAEKCELQTSYAIGIAEPVSIKINTFDTGKVNNKRLADLIKKFFDLTPSGIIQELNLLRPIYQETSTFGHFGRPQFSWEKTDLAEALRAEA